MGELFPEIDEDYERCIRDNRMRELREIRDNRMRELSKRRMRDSKARDSNHDLEVKQELPSEIEDLAAHPGVTGKDVGRIYKAATKDNADRFIDALERVVSTKEELPLSTILNTVSPSGDTLLHVAARHGRVEIMRLICEKLPSLVSKKNSDGDTVLHVAARQGSIEVVTLVCQKFPSLVTNKNLEGDTLLHVAARHGDMEIMSLVCEKFPSLLTKKNSKGDTVWHVASKGVILSGMLLQKPGNFVVFLKVFEFREDCKNRLSYSNSNLIKRDVTWEDLSLRATNNEGNTALHEALISRDEYIADKLVEEDVEVSFYLNKENKSALYLAAEAGYAKCLDYMLGNAARNGDQYGKLTGKSLVHAAIMGRHIDILDLLLKKEAEFIHSRDEDKRNPLHWAASLGFLEEVCRILSKHSLMADEKDKYGLFPIHLASMNGHVDVIKELLRHTDADPNKLLNRDGQNVLHVAAMNGRQNVISYIFKNPELVDSLINKTDKNGNTPLHLATMNWHPKVVGDLTWNKRVDLKLVNKEGMTALDAAEYNMKGISSFRQWLTWQALKAAGAPRASSVKVFKAKNEVSIQFEPPSTDNYKNTVKALLFVSFLIVMLSFIAGSTKPDLYNNADNKDLGSTTTTMLLIHIKSYLFLFCNRAAMLSSIVAAVTLIWACLGNKNMVFTALRLAKPLFGIALTMMALSLMAAVVLVVSKFHWFADYVLTAGMVLLVFFVTLFFPLCLPIPSGYSVMRYITYYPFHLMILITGSHA